MADAKVVTEQSVLDRIKDITNVDPGTTYRNVVPVEVPADFLSDAFLNEYEQKSNDLKSAKIVKLGPVTSDGSRVLVTGSDLEDGKKVEAWISSSTALIENVFQYWEQTRDEIYPLRVAGRPFTDAIEGKHYAMKVVAERKINVPGGSAMSRDQFRNLRYAGQLEALHSLEDHKLLIKAASAENDLAEAKAALSLIKQGKVTRTDRGGVNKYLEEAGYQAADDAAVAAALSAVSGTGN